jgi:pyruvate/2-oxoglutarate dehydrogenase complex dihydrolipoamide dehydrogenase (E3) component
VEVSLGRRATADDVLAVGADTVAIATGATPRRPGILGDDLPHVLDVRDVLAERAIPGRRVLVVSQDDHVAPLSVADFLSGRGHEVTVVFATATPAPLLGRYIVGAILGRLDEQGREVAVDGGGHRHRSRPGAHPQRLLAAPRVIEDVDSVVLACGSVSDSTLCDDLAGRHTDLHILGDAYAPRRLVFATKQAYALADLIARRPSA